MGDKELITHSRDCHMAWMQRLWAKNGQDSTCTPDCPHYAPKHEPEQLQFTDDLLVDIENEIFEFLDSFDSS